MSSIIVITVALAVITIPTILGRVVGSMVLTVARVPSMSRLTPLIITITVA